MLLRILLCTALLLGCTANRIRRQSCKCKPASFCAGTYKKLSDFGRNSCQLDGGKTGVCCQDITKGNRAPIGIDIRQSDRTLNSPASINSVDVDRKLGEKTTITITNDRSTADKSTMAHRSFLASRDSDKDIYEAAEKLLGLQDLGIAIRSDSDNTGLDTSNSAEVRNICPWTNERRPNCPRTNGREYRTVDGSCNNRNKPLYGMSGTPFQRIMFPDYAPNQQPRKAKSGKDLPNARLTTTTVFQNGDPPNHSQISEEFIQFGQFLDHDITHTAVVPVDCCDQDSQGRNWVYPSSPKHKECLPIRIMSNDSFWGPKGRTCMEFSRNRFAPTLTCRAGAREQVNALTHWWDLSNVYGSTEEEYEHARDPVDRRLLRISRSRSGEELPPACPRARANVRPEIEACRDICTEPQRQCFFSGDFRINEQPGLTISHLVWIREHNRLAEELTSMNPSWSRERIFQEARRINIAGYQHIIYNEWLPLALGPQYMSAHKLYPLSVGSGYALDYDESMDPRITNEFAGAAFRFGHSMVKSTFAEKDSFGRAGVVRDLKESFNQPNILQKDGFIEDALRGSTQNSAAERDQVFSDDLVNHLFQEDTEGGLDLMSMNIQRGRDRGIPGYNRYRQVCAARGFKAVSRFEQLSEKDGYMSKEEVRRLKFLYENVEDIDLFVGGMLEETHTDSTLGPTFKCIVGDQFVRLKVGDRFWFENPGQFSLPQLNELRKSSMARIICDNFKINRIQPLAFRTLDGFNQLTDCSDGVSIPRINLEVFRE